MPERIYPKQVYFHAGAKPEQFRFIRPRCVWTAVLTLFEAGAACDVVTFHGPAYSLWWRGCLAGSYHSVTGLVTIHWPDIRETARALIILRPSRTIPEARYEDRPASGSSRRRQATA